MSNDPDREAMSAWDKLEAEPEDDESEEAAEYYNEQLRKRIEKCAFLRKQAI